MRGVTDVGVFDVGGQPSLLISIDRAEAARYGIAAADINNAVQAAVGGAAVTQIIEGERRFDFAVRFTPQFRDTPEAIRKILLPTPDGNQIPLGNVANVTLHNGAFMIYREGGRRYIPIKFSVRGRDLQSTIEELKDVLARQVKLPSGYEYTWAGEYDSLQKELHRLAFIVPISLLIVLLLLYLLFQSFRDALIVLATLPFGAIGGIFTLVLTHTSFSISAAVGFTSLLGLNTLCTVVFLTGLRHQQHDHGRERGVFLGRDRRDAPDRHGLHGSRSRIVARGDRLRHRFADAKAAGARRGRRHCHNGVCRPLSGTAHGAQVGAGGPQSGPRRRRRGRWR